ncbi:hypothetical protein BC835DRAFT_1289792 [Cytidiella melzeri]|nr:hypothetical protein BC835DRAFT_1289792 [Cytidiella melzeri]
MDSSPSVSFSKILSPCTTCSDTPTATTVGIVDFTEDAKWVYCSESVQDLLGAQNPPCFEPYELIGHPSLDLVHPDELAQVRAIHYSTITQDQAAVLAYLRMRHRDPCRGYILCAISRTVCQNVLVGSVSFASPGPKALHNASTAQEITVITPTAKDFEFRRWGDPSPMPPCPVPPELMISHPGSPPAPLNASPMRFDPLPEQSVRTALILNRFSTNCDIQYCANDSILSTTHALGRSFFDFIVKRDEELVRSWIDVVKGWGVNERGQPSDGGFGYGKFSLLVDGRDSRTAEISPVVRHRQGLQRPPSIYQQHQYQQYTTAVSRPLPPSAPESDCLRDTQPHTSSATGRREFIRELTRERPIDRDATTPSLPARRHLHPPPSPELLVDAIFSAHSDGLVVIIRRSETNKFAPGTSGALPTRLSGNRPGSGPGKTGEGIGLSHNTPSPSFSRRESPSEYYAPYRRF